MGSISRSNKKSGFFRLSERRLRTVFTSLFFPDVPIVMQQPATFRTNLFGRILQNV